MPSAVPGLLTGSNTALGSLARSTTPATPKALKNLLASTGAIPERLDSQKSPPESCDQQAERHEGRTDQDDPADRRVAGYREHQLYNAKFFGFWRIAEGSTRGTRQN